MANETNNLGPLLLAISRQIAGRKDASCRSDRPERDLPILLIPNSGHGLTGSPRHQGDALPFLLSGGAILEAESAESQGQPDQPVNPSKGAPRPVLRPGLLGGPA